MSDPDIYVPSQTEKGPLHARDVEQARMPCFLGLDYPDDNGHLPETCPLCFDDMTHDSIFRRLPCNHLIHKQCIDKWLCTKDGSCPFCRETFYHLRRPIVVRESLPEPIEDEDKDELEVGRAAFVLWWKKMLCLV
ncbi:uncharacterized protein EURHEDRAFT_375718 [Aspergillus ruber CBS 135680]|uniref:RING-type domain-containing protein n=1 Tax=Aspergillus ruber (strain CBS 135680) TaxID=1388766 RepID=A0A017SK48_ASPRC|nr:uncharacterized protein EURHEDRAFT_375718 [Aspergillus ruber CBS 135680]EYE97121.1 hypothetical protein EURHEDRAFT_375718 [Aspergillus ruber CBS 135680]